jgi:Protein of unknown function (DUF935)
MAKHNKGVKTQISNSTNEAKINAAVNYLTLAAKSAKRSNPMAILEQLQQRARNRQRESINTWLQAIRTAEDINNPKLELLVRVNQATLLDNHLSSVLNTRSIRVLMHDFEVLDKQGKPDALLKELFEKPWFFKFVKLYMDSKFEGYGIVELAAPNESGDIADVYAIPREHINPKTREILLSPGDGSGLGYAKGTPTMLDRSIVELGKPYDLGLLAKATPIVIYKKNAFAAWSEFCEIFGMPIRVGKTRSTSADERASMEAFLRDMGRAPYAVIDADDTIEFAESKASGGTDVYDLMINRCNSEISKLIIGQTMTTDNGSSKSQATVHEGIAEDYAKADRKELEYLVNFEIIPRLVQYYGYKLDGCKFRFANKREITELDISADTMLATMYELDMDYLSEKYGAVLRPKKAPAVPK